MVDDEEGFLKITKMNLEETGRFEVLALLGAQDIISRFNSFKPDIILLDMLMPGISGIEACRLLNEEVSVQKPPIIILSALSSNSDELSAYKHGVVDYLAKPIARNELIARIEKALKPR